MRFLLDENAEYRLALFLRAQGHDVTVIARDYPGAMTDTDILATAYQEQRIVITNDRDFGALVFFKQQAHAGVILFRLKKRIYWSNNPGSRMSSRTIATIYSILLLLTTMGFVSGINDW